MQTETVFKIAFGVWVVLFFIIPIGHAHRYRLFGGTHPTIQDE